MTVKEFTEGWKHFCKCIDFNKSALDAEAIRFMNEMPAQIRDALQPDDETKINPYLLTGEELKRAESARKQI